ncbi:RND family efflux transporter, MFP subunit [Xenococcus sp. PCC 7305]|uniref:efflux RND transporter periplasmic adaptor subunit n=1 Tax=Xenococcus sp. PCC 7305 TaxID=102125 RepID=UPI0002ABFBB8|nr:efflux RND transporter periplasmic adaptor subunit [Xenococcus sp. PCC 7305]ELS00710.1 RND family efflux transporter, MFP subunit [Xenococcus sp. PCC 7305]
MKSIDTPPPQSSILDSKSKNLPPEKQQNPHKKSNKFPGWLIVILLLGGGATLWRFSNSQVLPPVQTTSQGPPPRAVEVVELKSGTATRQVKLLGQVEAGEIATLSSQVNGRVERVLVKEGDRVTAGMTVAILDDADASLALAEAQARLAQEKGNLARLQVGTRPEIIAQRQAELNTARARELEAQDNLERVASLTVEGALSQRVLVEARTQADAATSEKLRITAILAEAQAGPTKEEIEAQQGLVAAAQAVVRQAELARQRSQVTAAFSGIVQSRSVNTGDYVEESDPILTIVSDRSLDIFLEVPESLSGQVATGMRVQLNARALANWQQETTITAVIPTADRASRRQLVRVSLNNPPPGLLPGMAIQASLAVPVDRANTFILPRDALTRRGEQWLVFTVNGNQAQQLEVEMVADLGQEIMIVNPELEAGQAVVVRGGDGLTDNATVKVVN